MSVKSASEAFLASWPTRLGILAAGLPARSAPWHIAHFVLKIAAPSSEAHDRLGKIRNRARAIITIRITSFVIFMIAFPLRTFPREPALHSRHCVARKLQNRTRAFRGRMKTY